MKDKFTDIDEANSKRDTVIGCVGCMVGILAILDFLFINSALVWLILQAK